MSRKLVFTLLTLLIFATTVKPSLALAEGVASCSQLKLLSVYRSEQGLRYQEAVGTAVNWVITGQDYVLTVAHAVANATAVIGQCDGNFTALRVVGVDTDRDTALLAVPAQEAPQIQLRSVFLLPQGDLKEANRVARLKSVSAPKSLLASAQEEFVARDFVSLAIMHPFFKTAKIDSYQMPHSDLIWQPQIDRAEGIYRLQNLEFITQAILDSPWDQKILNPFYSFTPYFMTMGVRPGMSGAPVFEYVDTKLEKKNNLLVGLVSKTQAFQNRTLLIPSVVIEKSIVGILQGNSHVTEKMGYLFDAKTAHSFPYFLSQKLGLSFRNACDADSKNTSDISDTPIEDLHKNPKLRRLIERVTKEQDVIKAADDGKAPSTDQKKNLETETKAQPVNAGKGGDWGDGGGSSRDQADYNYTPFFTDSRYVPGVQCQRTGVIDQNGQRYIGYEAQGRLRSLRNLDELIEALRQKKQIQLVPAAAAKSVFTKLCQSVSDLQETATVEYLIPMSREAIQILQRFKTNSGSPGLHFAKEKTAIHSQCASGGPIRMRLDFSQSLRGSLSFTAGNDGRATLDLKIENCRMEMTAHSDGFEYDFKDENGKTGVRAFLNSHGSWIFEISRIPKECGLQMIESPFQGAIRIGIGGHDF